MKKSKRTFKKNIWSRNAYKQQNKYQPHQGKQEKARRRKQIEKGILNCRIITRKEKITIPKKESVKKRSSNKEIMFLIIKITIIFSILVVLVGIWAYNIRR